MVKYRKKEGLPVLGEVVADVAHVGCAQKGVADGMQQHVGIAMAQQSLTMLNLDATHPEVAAFH